MLGLLATGHAAITESPGIQSRRISSDQKLMAATDAADSSDCSRAREGCMTKT